MICRWFRYISEAADAYKQRTKGNADAHVSNIVDDPATATISNTSTKETIDSAAIHEHEIDQNQNQRDSGKHHDFMHDSKK